MNRYRLTVTVDRSSVRLPHQPTHAVLARRVVACLPDTLAAEEQAVKQAILDNPSFRHVHALPISVEATLLDGAPLTREDYELLAAHTAPMTGGQIGTLLERDLGVEGAAGLNPRDYEGVIEIRTLLTVEDEHRTARIQALTLHNTLFMITASWGDGSNQRRQQVIDGHTYAMARETLHDLIHYEESEGPITQFDELSQIDFYSSLREALEPLGVQSQALIDETLSGTPLALPARSGIGEAMPDLMSVTLPEEITVRR